MNDLRVKAYELKVAARSKELGMEVLAESDIAKIKNEVSKIILTKLDDTKDYQGCLYSENWKGVMDLLSTLLGFTTSRKHDSSQSCF